MERLASEELEDIGRGKSKILTFDPVSDAVRCFRGSRQYRDPGHGKRAQWHILPAFCSITLRWRICQPVLVSCEIALRCWVTLSIHGPEFSGPGNEDGRAFDTGYLDYIDNEKRDSRDPCFPAEDPCPGSRRNTVFVGSNGGMLHAFDARTLEEHFAYVPATVHGKLWELARPNYSHQFYVDGQVAVADAQREGDWATILVGTLGAGGRGIYALDVTQPQNFTESDVLWEFTAEDDPDLGFTYGEPLITRIDDTWVAVFGNGYNSEENQAYLYVVDLIEGPNPDGTVMHKIPLGDPGSNGLSGVAGWRDVATRTRLDRVYAGDLNGTVWRVDFDGGSPSVVYANGLFYRSG